MTKYDNECMIYLALEILKCLDKEHENLYIDIYYQNILDIYNDYKKYDNPNKSLLDSINKYIETNKNTILEKIKESFVEERRN